MQLGEDRRLGAQLRRRGESLARRRRGEDERELCENALAGDRAQPRRRLAGRRHGRPIGLHAQQRAQPRKPQDAERVPVEGFRRDHPQPALCEVGQPAGGVYLAAAGQRAGDRVDGKVAGLQVGFEAFALQGDAVDLPAAAGDPPAPEAVGELEGGHPGTGGLAQRLGRPGRVPGHHEVDVERLLGRRSSEQVVPHRPTDQPRLLAGELAAGKGERVAAQAPGSSARPSRW